MLMNDLSSRVDTQAGSSEAEAPTASTPAVGELLRRAESVRATLVFAGLALVLSLTVIVQLNSARRAATERPIASGADASRQNAPDTRPAPSAGTGESR
jgi:hypothetical protein